MNDPLVIAYLALGAGDAWAEAPDDQRERASDAHSGQLGYIGDVIVHAAQLDKLAEEYADDLPGVFVYDIAEPYGKLAGEALLRDTPLMDARTFVQAFLAQDRVAHGVQT